MNSILFHKYQNNGLLFSLDVLAYLNSHEEMNFSKLNEIAQSYGFTNYFDEINLLCKAGILEKTPSSGVRLAEDYSVPPLPLSRVEEEYLSYILSLPHADLFLSESVQNKLRNSVSLDNPLMAIDRYSPLCPEQLPEIDQFSFSNVLTAIQALDYIEYEYRTVQNKQYCAGKAIPWKLEYDAFDQRCWIILYSEDEDRMIKARLANLKNIKCVQRTTSTLSDKALKQRIKAASDKLIAGKVLLRVVNERNALERCAMVFERQALQKITQDKESNTFLFEFEYYKFDEKEITSRILYLGPAVQLLGPEKLKRELKEKIDRALALNSLPKNE